VTIRLVATDLDGTFFGADHTPTPANVAAINSARAAGLTVVAISGRSHFFGAAMAVSNGADLQWFMGSNGGHRYNYASGVLEERLTFPTAEVHTMLSDLTGQLGDVGFGFEVEDGVVWDERFLALSPTTFGGAPRVGFHRDASTLEEIGKVFVAHPELTTVDLVQRTEPCIDPGHNVTTSGASFVEITPAGADKGAALSRLCDRLGITASEVLAFGDNQNDLTMLRWAGRGVAMGNALPMVQAVADEIAPPNTDDGVAQVILALLSDMAGHR